MLAHLVPIGNSKGVRIPAALLRQYNLNDEIELIPGKDEIIIRPVTAKPRQGWDADFAAMHERGDDNMLIEDSLEIEGWEWK
jgi:antitoxin MazE